MSKKVALFQGISTPMFIWACPRLHLIQIKGHDCTQSFSQASGLHSRISEIQFEGRYQSSLY